MNKGGKHKILNNQPFVSLQQILKYYFKLLIFQSMKKKKRCFDAFCHDVRVHSNKFLITPPSLISKGI